MAVAPCRREGTKGTSLCSRASNSSKRNLFLNTDAAMGDSGIRRGMLAALEQQFHGVYSESNVAVVRTHQHSGIGGYLERLLQVTNWFCQCAHNFKESYLLLNSFQE